MWEYSALPWHCGHVFPACKFSIGPLRKANATSAFASLATRDESSRTVLDSFTILGFFIGGIVGGGMPRVSLLLRGMGLDVLALAASTKSEGVPCLSGFSTRRL